MALKEQYHEVEKVTTCNDGRPSHVSIQLFDKCCKGLTDYMHHYQGLINLCQRVHTEKEQQLDRFCTAWEDLIWERDTFAKEINRRDCCGEGVIDEKFARKLRKKMLRDPNRKKMLRDPNIIKNKECILYILSHSSVLPLVTLSQHHFVPSALTFQPRLLHYPLNSFSTTISSVNFFGKSIPLPFFFVFFFQCKYFLFVLIWFTKGDPPPLDNIQVLMPNDYIVQLYHRHC